MWVSWREYCKKRSTLLIDNAPYKGCLNPHGNCIFSNAFIGETEKYALNTQLLPFLIQLRHSDDIRPLVEEIRYGQQPIIEGHPLFGYFQNVTSSFRDITSRSLVEHCEDSSSASVQ